MFQENYSVSHQLRAHEYIKWLGTVFCARILLPAVSLAEIKEKGLDGLNREIAQFLVVSFKLYLTCVVDSCYLPFIIIILYYCFHLGPKPVDIRVFYLFG